MLPGRHVRRRRRQPDRAQCGRNGTARPRHAYGVNVLGTGNTIGGLSPNDRNVITGGLYDYHRVWRRRHPDSEQLFRHRYHRDHRAGAHRPKYRRSDTSDISIEAVGNIIIGLPGAGNLIADSWPLPYNDSFAICVSRRRGRSSSRVTRSARTPRAPPRSPTAAASTLRVQRLPDRWHGPRRGQSDLRERSQRHHHRHDNGRHDRGQRHRHRRHRDARHSQRHLLRRPRTQPR